MFHWYLKNKSVSEWSLKVRLLSWSCFYCYNNFVPQFDEIYNIFADDTVFSVKAKQWLTFCSRVVTSCSDFTSLNFSSLICLLVSPGENKSHRDTENMKVVYMTETSVSWGTLFTCWFQISHEGKRRHKKSFRDQDKKKKKMWGDEDKVRMKMKMRQTWRQVKTRRWRWRTDKKRRQRGRGSAEKGSKDEKEDKKTKRMTSYKGERWSWGWKQRKQRCEDGNQTVEAKKEEQMRWEQRERTQIGRMKTRQNSLCRSRRWESIPFSSPPTSGLWTPSVPVFCLWSSWDLSSLTCSQTFMWPIKVESVFRSDGWFESSVWVWTHLIL